MTSERGAGGRFEGTGGAGVRFGSDFAGVPSAFALVAEVEDAPLLLAAAGAAADSTVPLAVAALDAAEAGSSVVAAVGASLASLDARGAGVASSDASGSPRGVEPLTTTALVRAPSPGTSCPPLASDEGAASSSDESASAAAAPALDVRDVSPIAAGGGLF